MSAPICSHPWSNAVRVASRSSRASPLGSHHHAPPLGSRRRAPFRSPAASCSQLQPRAARAPSFFEWLKWHPRGHLIIAGSEYYNLWMWNANHNVILNNFAGHSSTVTCGDFTPYGKLICTGSDDASLRIWDPRTAQSRHVVRGHGYYTDGLTCLSITWDSQTIVSGSKDNSMCIVNINSGQGLEGFVC